MPTGKPGRHKLRIACAVAGAAAGGIAVFLTPSGINPLSLTAFLICVSIGISVGLIAFLFIAFRS
jgi:hypothetical protein